MSSFLFVVGGLLILLAQLYVIVKFNQNHELAMSVVATLVGLIAILANKQESYDYSRFEEHGRIVDGTVYVNNPEENTGLGWIN